MVVTGILFPEGKQASLRSRTFYRDVENEPLCLCPRLLNIIRLCFHWPMVVAPRPAVSYDQLCFFFTQFENHKKAFSDQRHSAAFPYNCLSDDCANCRSGSKVVIPSEFAFRLLLRALPLMVFEKNW